MLWKSSKWVMWKAYEENNNAVDGTEEAASTRSHSARVKDPFSYDTSAERAPVGKPQTSPNTKAQHPARESPNSLPSGRERGALNHSPVPLATNNSESTIKGKREGTTARAQSESPSFIQSVATSARRKSKAKLNKIKNARQIAPKRGHSAFFVCTFCNVILLFSFA